MTNAMRLSLPWKLITIHSMLDPFIHVYPLAPMVSSRHSVRQFLCAFLFCILSHCLLYRLVVGALVRGPFPDWNIGNGPLEPDSRMRVSAAWRSSVVLDRSVVDVVPAISCCWTCDIVGLTRRGLPLSR